MKRLYRSKTERILGGVCGGIGVHLDVDPIIIRIVWVVLTRLSLGIGIVAYIVCWIIIPEEQGVPTVAPVHE
ncbi:MAG: PspC domain-containing protein [Methanoregula sp.]|nr:PspC domain-containing protein [Methanoregula sp.]